MDITFIDKAATFPFRHIHQRADGIEFFSVQEANGSEAVQATLIKQRHKEGFHNIVLIMPQSDLIAAKLFRHIIQCALPHFCTERAGIFFFSLIKNDFADIGFHNGIMHTQLIAECLYAVIACTWQTEGDGHFTAMASYSGSATSSYVKGYTVTADYAGTVSRINLNKIRYVAIFEGTALDSTPEDISDPNTPADQTDSTGQEAQTGEKNSILPVVAVVASVLLGGGAFYFIKRRR